MLLPLTENGSAVLSGASVTASLLSVIILTARLPPLHAIQGLC